MLRHDVEEDEENPDTILEKIIKFEHDAGEPEIKKDRIQARCRRTQNKRKGSNLGTIPEITKQKEEIESGHDAGEPKTKGRDRIWAQCQRTRNKRKGSNPSVNPKNPKQKEGIESWRDVGEPETKQRGRI